MIPKDLHFKCFCSGNIHTVDLTISCDKFYVNERLNGVLLCSRHYKNYSSAVIFYNGALSRLATMYLNGATL